MTIVVAGVKMRGGGPGAKVLATGVHPAVKCESEGINISDLVLESTGDCSCVEVCKGSSLVMSGCSITSVRGSGVEVCGKVTAKECKMTECGQYGVIAREGGSFDGNGISLLSNSKTGLLARGKGSHAVCCKSVMGKNQGNGAGCDGGGHIEVNDSIVSENKLVGIMVGPVGTADVQSTELLGNGMHGVAVNSGSIKAKDTRMIQSRQLGAMVCPPSLPFLLSFLVRLSSDLPFPLPQHLPFFSLPLFDFPRVSLTLLATPVHNLLIIEAAPPLSRRRSRAAPSASTTAKWSQAGHMASW